MKYNTVTKLFIRFLKHEGCYRNYMNNTIEYLGQAKLSEIQQQKGINFGILNILNGKNYERSLSLIIIKKKKIMTRDKKKITTIECNIGHTMEDLYDDAFEDGEEWATERLINKACSVYCRFCPNQCENYPHSDCEILVEYREAKEK